MTGVWRFKHKGHEGHKGQKGQKGKRKTNSQRVICRLFLFLLGRDYKMARGWRLGASGSVEAFTGLVRENPSEWKILSTKYIRWVMER
jgi:hypothetical protein